MRTVQLLIVEDDDLDAEALERALRATRIGNPIHRATDGEEALAMLRGEPGVVHVERPVIVLLDLNMPRMTGLELLKALREDPEPALRRTVVFVLTTSDDERDRHAAYDEHVAGYIVKSRAGQDFDRLVRMLDAYWRLVELP